MELTNITSNQNKWVKHLRQLVKRNYREKHGEFLLEGVRIIEDALALDANIQAIFVSESFSLSVDGKGLIEKFLKKHLTLFILEDIIFRDVAQTETPQGLLAIAQIPSWEMDNLLKLNRGLFLYCDGVSDPGNLGTILRTSAAAGVKAVFLSKGTVDPYNPKTVRATMGALFSLPIVGVEEPEKWVSILKEKKIPLITTDLLAEKAYEEVNYLEGACIVVGNEGDGISDFMKKASDIAVTIPMAGKVESLNVSVATGIILFEAVRQNRNLNM